MDGRQKAMGKLTTKGESDDVKRLRAELRKEFNEKLNNLSCYVKQRLSSLEEKVKDGNKNNEGSFTSEKIEIESHVNQTALFFKDETDGLKRGLEGMENKIDACMREQQGLMENVANLAKAA